MREVGLLDLGGVQYQGMEAPAVALDDPEEWALQVLWTGLAKNGPALQTLYLLIRRPLWHDGSPCFWCHKAELW